MDSTWLGILVHVLLFNLQHFWTLCMFGQLVDLKWGCCVCMETNTTVAYQWLILTPPNPSQRQEGNWRTLCPILEKYLLLKWDWLRGQILRNIVPDAEFSWHIDILLDLKGSCQSASCTSDYFFREEPWIYAVLAIPPHPPPTPRFLWLTGYESIWWSEIKEVHRELLRMYTCTVRCQRLASPHYGSNRKS